MSAYEKYLLLGLAAAAVACIAFMAVVLNKDDADDAAGIDRVLELQQQLKEAQSACEEEERRQRLLVRGPHTPSKKCADELAPIMRKALERPRAQQ